MYKIGGNYQAIAVYDQAADWYEQYAKARQRTRREGADKALSDATRPPPRARPGGRGRRGRRSSTSRTTANSKPDRDRADRVRHRRALRRQGGLGERAQGALPARWARIDKAPPDIQVQAHATLARALMHLKADGDARPRRVREGSRALGERRRDRADQDRRRLQGPRATSASQAARQGARRRRRGDVLRRRGAARGRGRYHPVPRLQGPGNEGRRLKTCKTKVARLGPEEEARPSRRSTGSTRRSPSFSPTPPPRWVIAAGSRAGLMWGNFVDDFRAAPYPEGLGQEGLRPGHRATRSPGRGQGDYLERLDEASSRSSPSRAKPALKRCLDDSVKYQYFDEFSRDCEKWLAKNYKTEYHVVDELRGAPTLSNGGLDDKPPPLIVGRPALAPGAGRPGDREGRRPGPTAARAATTTRSRQKAARRRRRSTERGDRDARTES